MRQQTRSSPLPAQPNAQFPASCALMSYYIINWVTLVRALCHSCEFPSQLNANDNTKWIYYYYLLLFCASYFCNVISLYVQQNAHPRIMYMIIFIKQGFDVIVAHQHLLYNTTPTGTLRGGGWLGRDLTTGNYHFKNKSRGCEVHFASSSSLPMMQKIYSIKSEKDKFS